MSASRLSQQLPGRRKDLYRRCFCGAAGGVLGLAEDPWRKRWVSRGRGSLAPKRPFPKALWRPSLGLLERGETLCAALAGGETLARGRWTPGSGGVGAPGSAGPALALLTAHEQVSLGCFYRWGLARGLQPGQRYLERRKPAVRATGSARRHIQHQPSELLEETSTTRVLKGFSVLCH